MNRALPPAAFWPPVNANLRRMCAWRAPAMAPSGGCRSSSHYLRLAHARELSDFITGGPTAQAQGAAP